MRAKIPLLIQIKATVNRSGFQLTASIWRLSCSISYDSLGGINVDFWITEVWSGPSGDTWSHQLLEAQPETRLFWDLSV